MQNKKAGFVARWFYNGANLITLMRFPCIFAICFCFWPLVTKQDYWFGFMPITLFISGVIIQIFGMILDGLDGWWAKSELDRSIANAFPGSWWAAKFTAIGSTSEGQFLDQFVDKIFVWVVWFAICALTFDGSLQWLLLWWLPSIFLFGLDMKSCTKHWRNYKESVDSEFNSDHGAKKQGKWKFFFENITVCMVLLSLCPPQDVLIGANLLGIVEWFGSGAEYLHDFAFIPLFVAIVLSCSSLKSRGVKVLKFNKKEDSVPPKYFLEASTAEGPASEAEFDPI